MDNKKNLIILFQDCLCSGGVEVIVNTLANNFSKLKHKVYIIYYFDRKNYLDFNENITMVKLPIYKKHFIRNRTYKKYANDFSSKIEEIEIKENQKVSLILSNKKFNDQIIHYTSFRNVNYCYSIMHSTVSISANLYSKTGLKRLNTIRKYKKIYDNRNFITVSQGVQDDLINNFKVKTKNIFTIYNPFNFKKLELLSNEENIHKDENYIVYAGRLKTTAKNIFRLLESYKIASKKINTKLILIGQGEEEQNIKNWIKSNNFEDKIILVGFQKNPYKIMKDAKLLVLSSDFEGLPTVIIESLMCGTPVVSTDCPSGPSEILTGDMKRGLSKLNSQDLAQKIIEIYNNTYQIDYKFLKENFSQEVIIKKYLSLI